MDSTSTVQLKRAKSWQIVLYPLTNGIGNMFLVLMMFASYLAAGGYGIAVAVAGSIITFTRIFDGFTDPIIGLLSEKLSTRFGKVRIMLLLGWLIMAFAVTSLFFWGVGRGIVFFTLMYIVYIIGYTIFGVARHPGNSIITNDPKQRPKVFRWGTIYTTLLSTFTSVYMSKILFPKYGSLSMDAFHELCLTVVMATFVLLILSCIAISEADKPESFVSMNQTAVKTKDAFKLLKSNRALQAYIIAAASDKLALQTASQSAIMTMLFGIVIGNYSFYGTLNMINLVPTLIFIFLATRIAGSSGTKKTLVLWTWISTILAVVIVGYLLIIDPTKISTAAVPTTIFLILNAAFASSKMATTAVTAAMIPDIVDYENYRSGNFMPAVVGTVYAFVDKFISSFSTTIVGFSVALIGYTTAMPQPGDANTPAVFWMTMFLAFGIPVIGWVLTLIAMKFYPLDQAMMTEIHNTVHLKKGKESDKNLSGELAPESI